MHEALGQSEAFLAFTEQLSRVARVDRPVLLIGERGSGKELAAAKLHYLSGRWEAPLVALNCAALAPALIEAELFGHERGAFTGALAERAGRFEAADGGRVDEIVFDPFARSGRHAAPTAPDPPPPRTAPTATHPAAPDATTGPPPAGTLRDAIARVEIDMLRQALVECRHHQRRAAERLGLTYHQFRGLYRKHAAALTEPDA